MFQERKVARCPDFIRPSWDSAVFGVKYAAVGI